MCYSCGDPYCTGNPCGGYRGYNRIYPAPFNREVCGPNVPPRPNPCVPCGPCNDNGCLQRITTNCVFTVNPYSCIGSAAGDPLTTVLALINAKCEATQACCTTINSQGLLYNDNEVESFVYPNHPTLVKSFNNDYITNNGLVVGDIIEVTASLKSTNEESSNLAFKIYNGTTLIYTLPIPLVVTDVQDVYTFNARLNVTSTTSVRLIATASYLDDTENTFGSSLLTSTTRTGGAWKNAITGLDFTNLTVAIELVPSVNELGGELDEFIVEFKKKLIP